MAFYFDLLCTRALGILVEFNLNSASRECQNLHEAILQVLLNAVLKKVKL